MSSSTYAYIYAIPRPVHTCGLRIDFWFQKTVFHIDINVIVVISRESFLGVSSLQKNSIIGMCRYFRN